ncbi:uncharacterized protein Z520_06408 [Fonsecaea multimorphosa CBS 102226]|uniref:Uncharacterized protein n=1 Tax=Fonsecaea multimorphosa CBS 102226 TaxID=1442371 RepID=A0A0D2H6Y1_9EURO|nr:uncharacterized protein Z520_06408 [Fonsecaea multimorphosa CBS 102226]KIX97630.1 hypothetical protein Z520_06408 [Fonsecaea multimorphosa CBS 102226]OAL24092.1 hypothetical protein AYO22_05974 [Fonsecaea multimorphosa]
MADINPPDVSQHTAAQRQDVASSTPEPAAFRFWKEIRARQETLDLFLGHVFALAPTPGATIKPFYQQYRLAGALKSSSAQLVRQKNVDLNAMRVNKEFRDAGSRLVYGRYVFHFEDPENCQWWTEHIGNQNLANLRMLAVKMYSGWDIDWLKSESGWDTKSNRISYDVDLCQEEQWHRFFSRLRYRHNLDRLDLDFSRWGLFDAFEGLTEEWQAEVRKWREALLEKLLDLRGFQIVNISDPCGIAIPRADIPEWRETMTQAREPAPPVNPTPVPLEQTLQHLRDMRRQSEYRERMDQKSQKKERKDKKKRKRLERKAKEAGSSSKATGSADAE